MAYSSTYNGAMVHVYTVYVPWYTYIAIPWYTCTTGYSSTTGQWGRHGWDHLADDAHNAQAVFPTTGVN
jgi:hypothetical protein